MTSEASARELVRQVWEEVAAERATCPGPVAGLSDYDRLMEDADRHYINGHYVLTRAPLETAGGQARGVKGKLRTRATRFVVGALGRYLDDEQEFLAHLVRLQNTVTVHIDRLSAEVRQLQGLLEAESERLRGADSALHARLEDRIQALEDELAAVRRSGGGES